MSLTAALAYARHGIPVLPVHTPDQGGACSCDRGSRCDSPGKHPLLRRGLTEASTDPFVIEVWWSHWPRANIGLRTGVRMDVADVDSAEGWHGLLHLLGGELPPGPSVHTGGGGRHLWFHPTGFGNRVRLLPGLDWRGAGGYVLAPPSQHASGAAYTWAHRPGGPLPTATPPLRDLIAGPSAPPSHRDQNSPNAHPRRPSSPDQRSPHTHPGQRSPHTHPDQHMPIAHPDRYAEAVLHSAVERVARAPVGTRNDTLNREAFTLGRLLGAGLLDAAEVRHELEAAALYAGLSRTETRRTLHSGLTAGHRHPFDHLHHYPAA
ncbi:bifunctional DNA primase/polymerase [Actinoplanes sp. NPDC051851]|uniref:bifunctional DNA primase/polymerase n=1 Tax=Actinoplanes sp. NPDC051851 TaxID=3154753 RepID=UPI0034288B51